MKGLILSGGRGTRLRPITHTSAKQLVPIANKPILFYALEAVREAGIRDVGIVVGETKEEIKKAVGDGSRFGMKATYIEQEAPLGLAHAVKVSKPYLKDKPFVMFLGDNLVKDGIAPLVKEFRRKRPNSQILLARVREPERFGVAELKGDKVVKLTEKPKEPKSDLALVGVYMFDKNIFEAIDNIKPSWRNELEITDAIQYLIDHGYDVKSHIIKGWWKDTGRLEDMLEANRIILDTLERRIDGSVDGKSEIIGKVQVDEEAEIVSSTIRGPAIIGRGSKIVNSCIGPFTSIQNGVTIKGSEVEHSIIMEGTKIEDINQRIEDSLIGKDVLISSSPLKPKAYKLMVGDQSQVGLL